MLQSIRLTLLLFLLLNNPLNVQVPCLIIKSIKVLAFIINFTSNLIKLPLSNRFLLFTKCIVLQLSNKVLSKSRCFKKLSIAQIFIISPAVISIRLKSVVLILDLRYKDLAILNNLVILLAKSSAAFKGPRTFVLNLYLRAS